MANAAARRYFGGLTRNTVLLAIASLFADISSEMLYPVLPIFLTQTLKTSGGIVGLVEGIAGATQNIVQGFSGALSDRLQKRKTVALVGYALSAIGKPLIGLASTWPGALGGRFLDRAGSGIRSAPRDALIAASVDEKDRGRAFGLEGVGDNAGAFVGPLLAVVLLSALHVDIRRIFYIAVIPGLLAFIMIALVTERRSDTPKSKINLSPRRFPRPYWTYLFVTAVFGVGNSANAFLILQTKALGASLTATILIYAAFNLVAALISYPAGALSDRLGRRNVLVAALVVFLATYLGFALTKNLILIGALFVLYGLFQGIFRSAGKALASDLVSDDLRASGVGWYSSTVGLAGLAASLIAGVLWDRVGHAAVFLYGATAAAAGAVAMLALIPARPAKAGA
jgi:MFS family permease